MTGNRDRRNPSTKIAAIAPQDAATGQLHIVIAVSTDADYDAQSRSQFRPSFLNIPMHTELQERVVPWAMRDVLSRFMAMHSVALVGLVLPCAGEAASTDQNMRL